jgi:hypothetical protein
MPDTSTPTPETASKKTADALSTQTWPARLSQSVYFNGFSIGLSNADFALRANLENVELLELRMSFTTAKTLAEKLTETVAKFEEMTSHKLMTTEEVLKALQKAGFKK